MENVAPKMIVLTGGPGAGKTAVLELIRRSLCPHVAILPEAAGIVFGGGFPRRTSQSGMRASQQAIFHVQRALEQSFIGEKAHSVYLCDRGAIDGLAYWPGPQADFWKMANTTHAEELKRYSVVIHLRAPNLIQGYNHSNPVRTESNSEALEVDKKLLQVWEGHPNRYIVESHENFLEKAVTAIGIIRNFLPSCCGANHLVL